MLLVSMALAVISGAWAGAWAAVSSEDRRELRGWWASISREDMVVRLEMLGLGCCRVEGAMGVLQATRVCMGR